MDGLRLAPRYIRERGKLQVELCGRQWLSYEFCHEGKIRKPRPLSVKEIRNVNGIENTPHFRMLCSFLFGGSVNETYMFREEIRSVLLLL